jgi:hypothetical protein
MHWLPVLREDCAQGVRQPLVRGALPNAAHTLLTRRARDAGMMQLSGGDQRIQTRIDYSAAFGYK